MKSIVCFYGCIMLFMTVSTAQPQAAVSSEKTDCTVRLQAGKLGRSGIKQETAINAKVNINGHFGRIGSVLPHQILPVRISYPDAKPGEKVAVIAADGGLLNNNQSVLLARLDNYKVLDFQFQVAADPGLYRVFVRKGNDLKELQFWVGNDPVMKQ